MSGNSKLKEVVIGAEYDTGLWESLERALTKVGAKAEGGDSLLAGSQEVDVHHVLIDNRRLTITAETYIGLSLKGDSDLVDRIVSLVNNK